METEVIKKESNYFIKFCKWAKTFLEDHHGKISIKRVIGFMLSFTVCYVVIHITRNNDLSKFDWSSTNLFLVVMFGQITLLITAVIIEKKHVLDNKPNETTTITKQ